MLIKCAKTTSMMPIQYCFINVIAFLKVNEEFRKGLCYLILKIILKTLIPKLSDMVHILKSDLRNLKQNKESICKYLSIFHVMLILSK